MHLADAFIQSDLQLHSGYTFLSVYVFPGIRTHNLLCCWRNALPLRHTGTHIHLAFYANITLQFQTIRIWEHLPFCVHETESNLCLLTVFAISLSVLYPCSWWWNPLLSQRPGPAGSEWKVMVRSGVEEDILNGLVPPTKLSPIYVLWPHLHPKRLAYHCRWDSS